MAVRELRGKSAEGDGAGERAEPTLEASRAPVRNLTEPFTEGFRLLALDIERMLEGGTNRSVVVLSAMPKEGRTTVASHLARALTEIVDPVALIDANPPPMRARETRDRHPYQLISPWNRAETQAGVIDHIRKVLDKAQQASGMVVMDVPAATTSSLGFFLAPIAGGVLYLARPDRIRDLAVTSAVRAQLDLLGARILGVVVNEG